MPPGETGINGAALVPRADPGAEGPSGTLAVQASGKRDRVAPPPRVRRRARAKAMCWRSVPSRLVMEEDGAGSSIPTGDSRQSLRGTRGAASGAPRGRVCVGLATGDCRAEGAVGADGSGTA